ncbi:hypothetical protein PAI11_12720 [Patulibacter medicamentivorans]|uniref:PKD domain-containing protein n=1 Tax=Patulibacter medicamentivorans TaxID=1097667 RepID=H0E3A4_9ACTN|nr:PKD domain-containing protein [Patulibacter medicamentivorans]EHN11840.1 hypothetical protein PAI11_12720 [Patulibacter medicamentivorans]
MRPVLPRPLVPGLVGLLLAGVLASPAAARIEAATTVAGPDPAIVELGGVAMADDGTGGVVYRRTEDGRPHVFAARYDGQRWDPPQRVDVGQRFDSSWPRIGAATGGRLVVTWVQDGPPDQDSLYSAVLPRGGRRFLPPTLVDYTVGEGTMTYPSLAMAPGGDALLAYHAVRSTQAGLVGYVRSDLRLARFDGSRWKRQGSVLNRNRSVPIRIPTAAVAPRIAIAPDGTGVVAWQEPDESLIDRVWTRRVFASRVGAPLAAYRTGTAERPERGAVDGLDLAMTAFGRAIVAVRQQPDPRDRGTPPRIWLSALDEITDDGAGTFSSVAPGDGGAGGEPGPPQVALGGRNGLRVGFGRDGTATIGLGAGATATAFRPTGPALSDPAAVLDAGLDDRGTLATASADGGGRVVIQQLAGQRTIATQAVTATQGGPVHGLRIAGSGTGDALVALHEGEPDEGQIAVARVTSPPVPFLLELPDAWTRTRRPLIAWEPPPAGFQPLHYTVEIDGRRAARVRGNQVRLREGAVRDGVHRVRVVATDRSGETTATGVGRLRTDRRPPTASAVRSGRAIRVRIGDGRGGSGPAPASSTISWGDGSRSAGVGARRSHGYRRAGRYRITVVARDRAGNAATVRMTVRAPRGRP